MDEATTPAPLHNANTADKGGTADEGTCASGAESNRRDEDVGVGIPVQATGHPREPLILNIVTHLKSMSDGFQDSPDDSDGDVLAVLDQSPNAIEDSGFAAHRFIPYSHIFDNMRFGELMPEVFIRSRQVHLKVIEMEPLPSTLNFFNQYLITIVIHHGAAHWTIKRKTKNIVSLHNQLRIFKAKLKLPAATSSARERRQTMRNQMKTGVSKIDDTDSLKPSDQGKKLVK